MERTHHTREIPENRTLDTALAERTGRFTLEIDDHEIKAGIQYLPQMVVAVNPDFRRADLAVLDVRELIENFALTADDGTRQIAVLFVDSFQLSLQEHHAPFHLLPHRLVYGALVEGGKRFGRKIRTEPRIGKRQMHPGSPLGEPRDHVEIDLADQRVHHLRHVDRFHADDRQFGNDRRGLRHGEHLLVVAMHVMQRNGPGVAFVGDEILQYPKRELILAAS